MRFFYKLKSKKYLIYFLLISFLILSIDVYFFESVLNFKRYMFEKYGIIYFFILPIIITWFLFSIIDSKIILYFKTNINLIIAQLLSILIIIFLVLSFIYILSMSYVLFFTGIPE